MENADTAVWAALMENDPDRKVRRVAALRCGDNPAVTPVAILVPGRPAQPILVAPKALPKRRSLRTAEGRAALIHALAHIEFNAINLALDAVYRFPGLPEAFYQDWLAVAREEALHFQLLREHLHSLGSDYGALPAHDGLWQMAVETAADPLLRMALVPRVLEARGLDVTPGIQARLAQAGDLRAVEILERIHHDELGHVAVGSRWFRYLCASRGLDPEETFFALVNTHFRGRLQGPYQEEVRLQAGFSPREMAWLKARQNPPADCRF